MAAYYECPDCKGDGTRCQCHKLRPNPRPWKHPDQERAEAIAKNDAEIARCAEKLKYYVIKIKNGHWEVQKEGKRISMHSMREGAESNYNHIISRL